MSGDLLKLTELQVRLRGRMPSRRRGELLNPYLHSKLAEVVKNHSIVWVSLQHLAVIFLRFGVIACLLISGTQIDQRFLDQVRIWCELQNHQILFDRFLQLAVLVEVGTKIWMIASAGLIRTAFLKCTNASSE